MLCGDHNFRLFITEWNTHIKTIRQLALFEFMSELFKGKDGIMKHSHRVLFGSTVVLVLCLIGFEGRTEAMSVTSLDFTSGAVNWDGRHGRILDRLFAQDGSITMGSYQSMSDIVDPITRGHKTFSLFTSGFLGAPAPSATINGASISVDLSSLYLGWTNGSEVRAWNIGGMATGVINPQTAEFSLSWNHLFNERFGKGRHDMMRDRSATFFLQGTAGVEPAPVPLSSSLMFFGIGLALMGGLYWRKSGGALAGTAS
jgi:hypothetical protein